MRKALLGAAAAALLLVVAAAALPRFVNVDGFAPRLSALLGEATGSRATFSRPALVLFPAIGIRVAGLVIEGDAGRAGEPLVSAPEAELRVGFLALLQGRAEFATIVLRRPEIVVRKKQGGETSLKEAAERMARSAVRLTRTAAEAEIGRAAVRPRTLVIDRGLLDLRLESAAGRETRRRVGPFSARVEGIGTATVRFSCEAELDGFFRGPVAFAGTLAESRAGNGAAGAFDLAIRGEALDQHFSVDGNVADPLGRPSADLTVQFPRIDMPDLPGILSDGGRLSRMSPEGSGSLSVKLSGEPEEFGFEAEADLTRAAWAGGAGLRKFVDAPFSIVLQGRRFPDQVIVSNAELRFPPLLVIANASQSLETGAREWKASSRIASLEEFARSRGGLAGWAPAGILTASGHGRRDSAVAPDNWLVGVDLGNVAFSVPGRKLDARGLNGHVDAGPGALAFLPLNGLLNGQGFSLRGSVALGEAAVGHVGIRMEYLDLDSLVAAWREGAGPGKGVRGAWPRLTTRARLDIGAGKASGIDFRDLRCDAAYDNGAIRVERAQAALLGGTASLAGRVDLFAPSPEFRVTVAGTRIRAGELLSRKTSLADLLSGDADFTAEISGAAGAFDAFARTAAGSGSIRVTNGRIKGIDILRSALQLAEVGARTGSATAPGGAAGGETPFAELSATFRLSGGKARTESLRVQSDRLSLSGAATVGLDRTFEFLGTLRLPRTVRPPGGAERFLVEPGGRIAIPLIMSGSLVSPAVAIDSQALARGAAAAASR